MPTDQVITLPPDSTGKSVDMSELVTAAGVTVERERVNLSDPLNPNAHTTIRGETDSGFALTHDRQALELLQAINMKLDTLLHLLAEAIYS